MHTMSYIVHYKYIWYIIYEFIKHTFSYNIVCIYIYITWSIIYIIHYVYKYNVLYIQTDYFIVSQLLNMARHIGRLKQGSKPAQLYVRLSILPLGQQGNPVSPGIIRHYVVGFVCLHFCLTGLQSAQFIRRTLHYASDSCKFLC